MLLLRIAAYKLLVSCMGCCDFESGVKILLPHFARSEHLHASQLLRHFKHGSQRGQARVSSQPF